MSKTIITVSEVLEITPRAQGTDPSISDSLLRQQEEGIFRVWLGLGWYKELLLDLVDNSAKVPFIEGTSYGLGTIVLWNGSLYTCIQVTTGTQKPASSAYWETTKKFTTEINNTLYESYMKSVLAWAVFHSSVVYDAIRVTQLGVQRYGDNESFKNRPTSAKELSAFKSEIKEDLNLMLQNMDRYLRDNSTSFPSYRPNKISSSTDTQVGQRRRNRGFTTW